MGDITDAVKKWREAPRAATRPFDRRCYQCAYFDPTGNTTEYYPPEGGHVTVPVGLCRRRVGERGRTGHTEWPRMLGTDWCGEWEPAEPADWDATAAAMARHVLAGDLAAAAGLTDHLLDLQLRTRETPPKTPPEAEP
jgi:hypothetical protein